MRTLPKTMTAFFALGVFLLAALARQGDPPAMKFNDVREVAPGVFFRYASISATDPKVPFAAPRRTLTAPFGVSEP